MAQPHDRRHTDRRLQPGTCANPICHHPVTEHLEGSQDCLIEGCLCEAFEHAPTAAPEPPTPPAPAPRKKAAPKTRKR